MNSKLEGMTYSELHSIRCVLKSLCEDLSEMATTYQVVNETHSYDELPTDIRKLISERQEFYGYLQDVNSVLRTKIRNEFR